MRCSPALTLSSKTVFMDAHTGPGSADKDDASSTDAGEAQEVSRALSPGRRRLVFAATMATTFMAAIEIHIVATAMPSILPQLGGFHLYSWVFGGFVLTQAVATPVYGKLADLYGRRRILATGTILFLIASLLCGLATSMPELIVYRALQGLAPAPFCRSLIPSWGISTRRNNAPVFKVNLPVSGRFQQLPARRSAQSSSLSSIGGGCSGSIFP